MSVKLWIFNVFCWWSPEHQLSVSYIMIFDSVLFCYTGMTLTLPFSTLVLSLLTMSSVLYAVLHLVTWPMLPWPKTLRSFTNFAAPLPNASGTTTAAPSRGACMAVCTAAVVTWAWGMPPSQQMGELYCRRWPLRWRVSSLHVSPTTPHQQLGGASWWWSTATLRMGRKATGLRRRTWWWMMVPPPASTTCNTIRHTMAHQDWTTQSTAHCRMTSDVGQHRNKDFWKYFVSILTVQIKSVTREFAFYASGLGIRKPTYNYNIAPPKS